MVKCNRKGVKTLPEPTVDGGLGTVRAAVLEIRLAVLAPLLDFD